jgi:ferredoxin
MSRRCGLAALGLFLVLSAGSVLGELIPTPDFSQHPIPTSSVPSAAETAREYVDVVSLALALGLATYWALVTRSRRSLFLLSISALVWFGFVRKGCVCPIGATQNIALAIFQPAYVVPLSMVILFVLPLLVTLFFGRTFCAAVCPLGAVQELVAVRSVRVPGWLHHALSLIPFVYLGAAVLFAATGTAFLICRYDPFVAFFRLNGNANLVIFGVCLLVIGVFVGRPYCRYLCPYGALLGILSRYSRWHVRIPPDKCINCRLCEDVCPYGAIDRPTVDPTPADVARGRQRLAAVLLTAPLIVVAFALLGTRLGGPLSLLDPEVQLAEQVRREELGLTATTTDASDAFRAARRPASELYAAAGARRDRFGHLGIALGVWVGLVLAVKLVSLSVHGSRSEYEPNRTGCVSCGRCFWYCPVEQVRLGLIQDPAERMEST